MNIQQTECHLRILAACNAISFDVFGRLQCCLVHYIFEWLTAIRTWHWFFVQVKEIWRCARILFLFRISQIILALCQMVIVNNMPDLKIEAFDELSFVKLTHFLLNLLFCVAMTRVARSLRSCIGARGYWRRKNVISRTPCRRNWGSVSPSSIS